MTNEEIESMGADELFVLAKAGVESSSSYIGRKRILGDSRFVYVYSLEDSFRAIDRLRIIFENMNSELDKSKVETKIETVIETIVTETPVTTESVTEKTVTQDTVTVVTETTE